MKGIEDLKYCSSIILEVKIRSESRFFARNFFHVVLFRLRIIAGHLPLLYLYNGQNS